MNLDSRDGGEIMDCEQVKERIALYVLDLLEHEEAEILRRHLGGGCPGCASEMASAREALSLLPYARPFEEPSTMVKARIMAAVRKDSRSPAGPQEGRSRIRPWAGSIAAALMIAVLTGVVVNRRDRALMADLRRQLHSQEKELVTLRQQMIHARDTLQLVSSPGVSVIDLAGQGDRTESAARVFWDRRRETWRIFADSLPPAGPGRSYQLWMVTATAKISGGIFDPTTGPEAAGSVTVPEEAGAVVAAAVTEEPQGGSPQPTGRILLLGKI